MKRVALFLALAGAAVIAGTATAAAASAPTCSLASPARVKTALGITFASASIERNGPVTLCIFAGKAPLLVRFETGETMPLFAAGRKGFGQHGEKTKTVSGLGTAAYSSSIGATSNTIVVLKGRTELLITGSEPLAKLEALAKLILPSL